MAPMPAPPKAPKPPTRLARLLKRPKMPAVKCSPVKQETTVHVPKPPSTKKPDNSKPRRPPKFLPALCCCTAVVQDAIKAQPSQNESKKTIPEGGRSSKIERSVALHELRPSSRAGIQEAMLDLDDPDTCLRHGGVAWAPDEDTGPETKFQRRGRTPAGFTRRPTSNVVLPQLNLANERRKLKSELTLKDGRSSRVLERNKVDREEKQRRHRERREQVSIGTACTTVLDNTTQ